MTYDLLKLQRPLQVETTKGNLENLKDENNSETYDSLSSEHSDKK